MSTFEGRRCLFCESPGATFEHLFGDWLVRQIAIPPNAKHQIFDGNKASVEDGFGNGLAVSKKIKGPCAFCNNTWMSELEKTAGQLLLSLMTGNPEVLDPVQQRTIATWLAVKSMVWEYQEDVTSKSIPQSDRDFIFANREPAAWRLPDDWYVWLGKSDSLFGVSGASHISAKVIRQDHDGTVWPQVSAHLPATVHCFALHSGAFIGLVLRTPFVGDGPLFSEAGVENLRPIWPLSTRCDWPPPGIIPELGIRRLPQILVDAMIEALDRNA